MKTNKGISCPSCGRFVGAHDRCPYCGTGLQKRVSLKSLRYISLIVAIVGLVCLQLMAMSRETPAKEISSITPAMNFAYIKVKGIATRPMKYYRTGDKVSSCYIYLKDKTGIMRVTAFRQVAEKLYNKDIYIVAGDEVEVSGKIRVVEGDKISMTLEVPDHLKIKHKDYGKPQNTAAKSKVNHKKQIIKLSDISANDVGNNVLVEAIISEFSKPREGSKAPYRLIIEQEGTKLPVIFWQNTFSRIAMPEKLVSGSKVQVEATVGQYRDKIQLRLKRSNNLIFLKAEAVAAKVKNKKSKKQILTPQEAFEQPKGSRITVRGKVVDVFFPGENSRAPNKIYFETDDGRIPVVFWPSRVVLSQEQIPSVGAEIEVNVTVSAYKENKQLKLSRASNYKLISAGREADKPEKSKFMPLDELWDAQVGSFVKLKGQTVKVYESQKETAPFKIIVADNESNTVTVVAWPDVWNSIPESKRPKVGDKISLKGKVKKYKQRKQIQLKRAEDIIWN
ncbi:MAG: hypothetical protein DRI44_02290 [Chlamydiae bacterium]|nr:MAG: hypothetical protein DRI44_02290 [Chlamydiota bacterium]